MVIFSSTRVYPDVSFDSESSKENQLDIRYLARFEKQFHRKKMSIQKRATMTESFMQNQNSLQN